MEDTLQPPENFWMALYSIFCIFFLRWLFCPAPPLEDTNEDKHSLYPAPPPLPRRRPAPRYITLADLAKKVDAPPATWLDGYPRNRRGMPEQTTTYAPPTRNLLVSPVVQRGRWEALSAAAGPSPPPPTTPPSAEQYANDLADFSAFLRASANEPPFVPPQGLQDALRPRQPPPFVFPRPKGPVSDWQCRGLRSMSTTPCCRVRLRNRSRVPSIAGRRCCRDSALGLSFRGSTRGRCRGRLLSSWRRGLGAGSCLRGATSFCERGWGDFCFFGAMTPWVR